MNKTVIFGKATVTSSDSSDLFKEYCLHLPYKQKKKLLNINLHTFTGSKNVSVKQIIG